jgi:glycerol-3-phosphate dehydrogenase
MDQSCDAYPWRVPANRQEMLDRLASETFDVVVIGGGVTGLGVALDAASRGLRCALVEKNDFSSGTSSKSSKLVHGGLRYLQQGEIGLVYEALHERQRLLRNAPHLVQILPFMIPILTKDGVISRKIAKALGSALWMYDLTGGWRIGKFHRRLTAHDAHRHMPTMPRERLSSAYLYFDATADDSRLCVALARSAQDHGAVVVNHCTVKRLTHDVNGRADGAVVTTMEGAQFTIKATSVVNAAGVWSDRIHEADTGTNPQSIRPAKGIHLTVPWDKVRNDIAIVIPVRRDKRSLFVVPWIQNADGTYRYTYIGTTDTDFAGGVDESQCSRDDIDYALEALNEAITTTVTRDDITGVWSGLRPLVRPDEHASAKTADLSRKHRVEIATSGLITIIGGKLTTYRKMAEHTVDAVLKQQGKRASCRTKRLALHGADAPRKKVSSLDGGLRERYGSDAVAVASLINADASLGQPLIDGLPYRKAEALYAVREEMALTVDDVLSRRTRALLLDRRATQRAARSVAELIAPELGWDATRIDAEVAAFHDICAREEAAAMVTEAEYLSSL